MSDAIAHRGPDGETYFTSPSAMAYFAHRRLCVIDPSPAGSQPFQYNDRFTIMHNGEIYNYLELKKELEKLGFLFHSKSDTEVIVAAYQMYGKDCLQHFDGMFAFVIWDEKEKILFMARDRFGEKPLFFHYDQQKQFLCFASEMKALWSIGISNKLNPGLLLQYLALGYRNDIEGNHTYYDSISQIPPAHYAIYDPQNYSGIQLAPYWDLDKEKTIDISISAAVDRLNELLTASVAKRLRTDVPPGATVSGGLDSSSLLAIATGNLNLKLPCFSAVFAGFKNEMEYVELLKKQFNNIHHYTIPNAEGFVADFEKLLYHQEQPFSSTSVYAQFKVFELAKQNKITVLLDGQGADEIFGGYMRYIIAYLREILSISGRQAFQRERSAIQQNGSVMEWSWKHTLAATFPYQASRYLARKEKSKLKDATLFTKEFLASYSDSQQLYKPVVEKLNDLMYYNIRQNGLPELLRYADRNAMAHSTEARMPFLDHKLVEFIFLLPSSFKIHKGWTKWILRKAIEPVLPSAITWRKEKIAFEPPQKDWMNSKQVMELIHLAKEKLVKEKIIQSSVLTKKIQPHDAYAAENYDWRYLVTGSLLT